jgi:hypothetical protein
MIDPSTAIENALYSLLNGNVTYNSKKVKVFKRTPKASEVPIVKGALYNWIEIGDISDTETAQDSDTFTHDTTVDLQVVVGFPGIGDKAVMNNISNQVQQLVFVSKGAKLSLTGFTNVITTLDIAFQTREDTATHKVIVKTIRIRIESDEN